MQTGLRHDTGTTLSEYHASAHDFVTPYAFTQELPLRKDAGRQDRQTTLVEYLLLTTNHLETFTMNTGLLHQRCDAA